MTVLELNRPEYSRRAPFLCWPVARREYFYAISLSMLPAVVWGTVMFGWRALVLLGAALLGAFAVHFPLKKFTKRGKWLLSAHTLTTTLLLVALCDPMWPAYLVGIASACAAFLIWLEGGPGHERVHTWAVMLVLLASVAVPWHVRQTQTPLPPAAVVARDRLVMGDIRHAAQSYYYNWPRSVQINGNDAFQSPQPSKLIIEFWREISAVPEKVADASAQRAYVESTLTQLMADKLPNILTVMLGICGGYLGATSAIWLVAGGLFLAYRNILRLRSCLIFFFSLITGFIALSLYSGAMPDLASFGLRSLWQDHLAEMVTLILYQLLSSDILFAGIFVLAIPGTEPITPNARRIYLILAGLTAAFLHRMNLPFPPTAITLAGFAVISPLFDSVLARHSWLSRSGRW